MPDLTSELLPTLKEHRLPGLDLGEGFIYPNYAGRSILNIPASLCRLLGVPEMGTQALSQEILTPLGGDYKRVILILMDALALHRLQRWMEAGMLPVWEGLAREGVLAPLTSITPSTTSAALTTLWTGQSPAQHGIAGYEMWLKEYGVVANMISHAPMYFQGDRGSLAKAGFRPEEFLQMPTLGTHLTSHGVNVHGFQHFLIAHSGLSRMFFPDVEVHGFGSLADLWVSVRQLLEDQIGERLYTWVYWGDVDHLSHIFGPDNERVAADLATFSMAFERDFLSQLSAEARKDTLVILTADHGQIATRKDPHYDVGNHPGLSRRLHILPTGENRLMYLFVRPGQGEAVREYIERTWPNQFAAFEPGYALHAGLFGPGEISDKIQERLGDLVVAARGEAYLWWGNIENPLTGRHGGLTSEEMLVPFLAARLG